MYPIKANIPLYKEWRITFEDDCTSSNNIIVKPEYVSIENLKKSILDMALQNGKTSIEYIESTKPKGTSRNRKFHKK
ncbi:hypothetical protein ACJDU8_21450 [Clostridium sp. WILCCON 0269]|uniref:Uncharacterized protein n=1 Tax=Candidatus Clostridium eludens TaxID=3381663 RepID=A0ABW8SR06_9CLOT